MKMPPISGPVLRGPIAYRVSHAVAPSSVCSICKSIVSTVVDKAGCGFFGLLEFEAECNVALDVETDGAGAAICAAAGVALKAACNAAIKDPGEYVAGKACALLPGC